MYDYSRDKRLPAQPLQISDLSGQAKRLAFRTRFLSERFDRADIIEPLLHHECSLWRTHDFLPKFPQPGPIDPIDFDATGSKLLANALLGDPDGVLVFGDWLQAKGHKFGRKLTTRPESLFPDVLRILPVRQQHDVGCVLTRAVMPDLELVEPTCAELGSDAIRLKEKWLKRGSGPYDIDGKTARFRNLGAWVHLVRPHPMVVEVANEASWMETYCKAGPGQWLDVRQRSRERQMQLVAEYLTSQMS